MELLIFLKRREGAIYYRLTSVGLFCALKEIEKYDVGDTFAKTKSSNNIFKSYGEDMLFQIFIDPIIDRELLSSITSGKVLWAFISYIKQVCIEIKKELQIFKEFQKKGIDKGPSIKWNDDLKNDRKKWKSLISSLIGQIIPISLTEQDRVKLNELIHDPIISSNHLSFYYYGKKYSIEIDRKSRSGK